MSVSQQYIIFVAVQVRPSEAVALLSAVSRASGNTALHAAVNACSVPCVRALCAAIGVQRAGVGNESVRALVNQPNSASDDTTPLHLAIIHGTDYGIASTPTSWIS